MISLKTLQTKSKQLELEMLHWRNVINAAPKGRLIARESPQGQYRYSSYDPDISEKKRKENYISRKKIIEAEKLAFKEYASWKLEDCRREKAAIDHFLGFYQGERRADHYLATHPGAARLILPRLEKQADYITKWRNESYIKSDRHLEQLKYPTIIPNLLVRSKSEADWIMRLVHFGVPFRYEELVYSNGIYYHPDFSCLNVRTLEKIYIEHQGGWDMDSYVDRLHNREMDLKQAGIIPWKNLLITTETKDQPLDINWVDVLIQYYLL